MSLRHVKQGDVVIRVATQVQTDVKVVKVDDKFIYCSHVSYGPPMWKFSRHCGAEIHETLGYDTNITRSYIVDKSVF
jgi:hypothetical protein